MRSTMGMTLLALCAGFVGGILSQQFVRPAQAAMTSIVTARDFRLVDASGGLQAELGMRKFPKQSAVPALVIYGSKKQQVALRSDGMFFGRGYGDEDLGIGYADQTSPAIYFWYHKQGRMGIQLDAKNDGAPSMFMYDKQGATIWRAPTPAASP